MLRVRRHDYEATCSLVFGFHLNYRNFGMYKKSAANRANYFNYSGWLLNTDGSRGTEFDSSLKPGRGPFKFQLGAGQVIPGWDKGVAGMKVHGKRVLTIPSGLAYGERGAGNVIPPNSTLVFE